MNQPTRISHFKIFSALSLSLGLGLSLNMCKPAESVKTTEAETPPEIKKSDKHLAAEKIIDADTNIEIVEVSEGKMHIQNIHTKLGLSLPFQEIIDGNYSSIQGGVAEAARILPSHPPMSLKMGGHNPNDWGRTPDWIPRYPKLSITSPPQHAPKSDGSIWGEISGTHTDTILHMRDALVSELVAAKIPLDYEKKSATRIDLMFRTVPDEEHPELEQRRVHCSLVRQGDLSYLTLQYLYGME